MRHFRPKKTMPCIDRFIVAKGTGFATKLSNEQGQLFCFSPPITRKSRAALYEFAQEGNIREWLAQLNLLPTVTTKEAKPSYDQHRKWTRLPFWSYAEPPFEVSLALLIADERCGGVAVVVWLLLPATSLFVL